MVINIFFLNIRYDVSYVAEAVIESILLRRKEVKTFKNKK